MKKIFIIFLLCLFAFNPLILFADESNTNIDLEVQKEIDSWEQANDIGAHSAIYVKYFKIINNSNNSLIFQKVETKSGFDNKKGYDYISTGYLRVLDDIVFGGFFFPFWLRIPYDMVVDPCLDLYKRQQLMSIYKYQKGKYKLKPHKSITIVIVPINWQDGQGDELTIYYKKSKSSPEIKTFKYQFKYSKQKYNANYMPIVRTCPYEKDCTKNKKTN